MAELGAVASVVQLADVALRISGEVCKFLDAYKNTDRNAKLLWNTLRDVEANVRSLRGYVIRFRKSQSAIDEYENLSETIMGALKGYDADILAVKKILPQKPLEKVEKIRWALKKREAQELMERITQRNSSLTTALGIMESHKSLRIRKNTQDILSRQTASDIVASKNFSDISSKMQKQEEDHVELLSHSRNVISSTHSMKASSNRQHKTLTSVATKQAALINDRLRRINTSSSRLAYNTKQANIKLIELSSQVQQSSRQTQQMMDAMIAEMKGIHAKTTFSTSSIDIITRIVREEIRTTLTPLIQDILNQKEMQREEALWRLENLNDTITRDIGSDISSQQTAEASNLNAVHATYSDKSVINRNDERSGSIDCKPNVAQLFTLSQNSASPHYTTSTYKRRWSHSFSFGMLEITITHTHHRINGSPQSRSYTSIEVHLWPVQKYLSVPRISAFYSTAPTSEGYYQLAPTIALYPILAEDHLAFSVIESGDLAALQKMLATGQIHLRSCDSTGATLLHSAASHGKLDICKFLNGQGLSWYQESIGSGIVPTPFQCWIIGRTSNPDRRGILQAPLDISDTIEFSRDDEYKSIGHFLCIYYCASGLIRAHFDYLILERDFRERWPNHWDEFRADLLAYAIELSVFLNTTSFIDYLLQSGVSPDTMGSHRRVPLLSALSKASSSKDNAGSRPLDRNVIKKLLLSKSLHHDKLSEVSKQTFPIQQPNGYERCFFHVTSLIVEGADIHYINPTSFDCAENWSELITPFQHAIHVRLFHDWRLALELSGRNPDHDFLENERRRKQAFRLRGATRSGVDEAILDSPSISGLLCRRCRRKFCNNHDLSIFE